MMRGEYDEDGTVDVRRQAERTLSRQLQLASMNFRPVEQFLDRMGETLTHEYGPSTALQRRGGMQPKPSIHLRCGTPFLIQNMLHSRLRSS